MDDVKIMKAEANAMAAISSAIAATDANVAPAMKAAKAAIARWVKVSASDGFELFRAKEMQQYFITKVLQA